MDKKLKMIMELVEKEFNIASKKFGKFNTAHEGYAIMLEEIDELWENIKMNPQTEPSRSGLIRHEALQVAAMAIRIIYDFCNVYREVPLFTYIHRHQQNPSLQFKLDIDPKYIEKSKKSICKDCNCSELFNGEYYPCLLVNRGDEVEVFYKQDGIFHTEIIQCNKFEPKR